MFLEGVGVDRANSKYNNYSQMLNVLSLLCERFFLAFMHRYVFISLSYICKNVHVKKSFEDGRYFSIICS